MNEKSMILYDGKVQIILQEASIQQWSYVASSSQK